MQNQKKSDPQDLGSDLSEVRKLWVTDCNNHPFLGADTGDLEIITYYADNEPWCRELRFSVPASVWSEFENSQLFRDLTAYVQSLEKQIPDMHNCNYAHQHRSENLGCANTRAEIQ